MILDKRSAGILLHVTSIPSKYGVGTMGAEAYAFVDWMKKTGLEIWQVLPLVPTNYGDSPYQSVSSTALNYYLIDLDILREKGLLKKSDYENVKWYWEKKKTDYSILFHEKTEVLKKAFANFDKKEKKFVKFVSEGFYKDFAVFMTIKEKNGYVEWKKWEEKYQTYSEALEEETIRENEDEYLFWVWTQYEFTDEWTKLKKYANKKGISIMGDMPLYVAYDSVEVWKKPEMFALDEEKGIKLMAGCPPDCFTEDGQLWGNPCYDWDYMKKDHYSWWNERIQAAFDLYDIVRIDHFRGFDRFYAIPAGYTNARIGSWMDGPKFDLFTDKTDLNIVAEDLGFIDEGVRTLLKNTGYPGMKIMEFAFDGSPKNEHKPSLASKNYIIYTGTHDNMPLYQYIKDLSKEDKKKFISDVKSECAKLGVTYRGNGSKDLNQTVIELGYASDANTCIIPAQDLLNMDGSTRMNLPSTVSTANWSFRLTKNQLSDELSKMLKNYIKKYRR